MLFDSVNFSEKLEVTESTRRLAESILDRPFGEQTFDHRKYSAIFQKSLPIADLLFFATIPSVSLT